MPAAARPLFSVVLAAREAGPPLARCLDSLARQTLSGAETTVALRCDDAGDWARRYPAVCFLPCGRFLDDPELLRLAIARTTGEIVVVVDAHCVLAPEWLEALRRAHDSEFAVIGGSVEHGGPDHSAAWACYLADYAAFAPGAPRGPSAALAGSHISYKRAILEESVDSLRCGYWKVFLLQDLARRGVRFLFAPELVLRRVQDDGFAAFAQTYFRNASRFAAARVRASSPGARLARLLTTPALPLLLFYRRLLSLRRVRLPRLRLLAATPWIAVLVLCWSAGEFAGYLFPNHAAMRD